MADLNTEFRIADSRDLVGHLERLGVEMPEPIATAAACFAAVEAIEVGHVDLRPRARSVTPAGVAALHAEMVAAALTATVAGKQQAALRDELGRRLNGAVRDHADVILNALKPIFSEASSTFASSYRRLPSSWPDKAKLVDAGGDAVDGYARCREAVATLDALAGHRRFLAPVPDRDLVGRACMFVMATTAQAARGTIGARSDLGPWSAYAEAGDLWWPTEAERKAHVADLLGLEAREEEEEAKRQPQPARLPNGLKPLGAGRARVR